MGKERGEKGREGEREIDPSSSTVRVSFRVRVYVCRQVRTTTPVRVLVQKWTICIRLYHHHSHEKQIEDRWMVEGS